MAVISLPWDENTAAVNKIRFFPPRVAAKNGVNGYFEGLYPIRETCYRVCVLKRNDFLFYESKIER